MPSVLRRRHRTHHYRRLHRQPALHPFRLSVTLHTYFYGDKRKNLNEDRPILSVAIVQGSQLHSKSDGCTCVNEWSDAAGTTLGYCMSGVTLCTTDVASFEW